MKSSDGLKTSGPHEDRRRLLNAILILGLSLVTIGGLVTAALFTDTASVGANAFSTGSVDISASPASAAVTFSTMAPGDVVTNPITVSNAGTLQLRYAVKSTTTENTLAAQLDMTIKSGVTTCTNGGFGSSGTVRYGPADLGSTAGVNVIGDPTQGSQAGDRVLAAGANEDLCVQVSLPLSTGNAFQSLSTTATLDFIAEQTTNN
jgi:spore coat-associated protein N